MKLNRKDRFTAAPHAILFDIDNTIYGYDAAHASATAHVQKKAAALYLLDEAQFISAFTEARGQIKAELGHTAAGHSRLLYFQRTLELLGLGGQILAALDLEQTYWRSFLLAAELFEGVAETLAEIRLQGIPLGFVTDLTAQIQMRKLIHFGLDKYIDFMVTSEESGADKVAPASYQLALRKAGVEDGARVWMVGDNPTNDIAAAREGIGAITVQKLHAGVIAADPSADATFTEFSQLTALIAGLRKGGT